MPDTTRRPGAQAATARFACGCPRPPRPSAAGGAFQVRFSVHLPGCTLAMHEHAEARIVLPLQHVFESRHARRVLPVRHGEALYRPAGQPHSDRYDAPVGCVALLLPAAPGLPRVGDAFVAQGVELRDLARALRAEISADDPAAGLVREGLALLASTLVLQRRPLAERGSPRWLRLVVDRLADASAPAPTLAELAHAVGREPAHVAAMFRRVYGQSVGTTLRRLRLEAARRCLERDPECTLAEAALRSGFADQSHFTRHFGRLFGVTPGAYRRRQRSA
jgi:AraC-like DNA-binding protein